MALQWKLQDKTLAEEPSMVNRAETKDGKDKYFSVATTVQKRAEINSDL